MESLVDFLQFGTMESLVDSIAPTARNELLLSQNPFPVYLYQRSSSAIEDTVSFVATTGSIITSGVSDNTL